jgi:hypothetical protein
MKEYIAEYIVPVEKKGNDCTFDFMNAKRLIRCRDCKYNDAQQWVECTLIPKMFGKTADNNFCSYAEPKVKK